MVASGVAGLGLLGSNPLDTVIVRVCSTHHCPHESPHQIVHETVDVHVHLHNVNLVCR